MCNFFGIFGQREKHVVCGARFAVLTRKCSLKDPVYLKYPKYVSLRCCATTGLSLASAIVCACVRVVLHPHRVIVVFPTTEAKSR